MTLRWDTHTTIVFFFGFQNLHLKCRALYSLNLHLKCRIKKQDFEMTENLEKSHFILDRNLINYTCFCGSAAQRNFFGKIDACNAILHWKSLRKYSFWFTISEFYLQISPKSGSESCFFILHLKCRFFRSTL